MKKLYVGNLSYDASDDDLEAMFAEIGPVASVKIIRDKFDGSSKGFGFVEYEQDADAEKAISQLDGGDFKGRSLRVSEAREKSGGGDRRGGGGGGGRRDNRGGGGNRGGHGGGNRGGNY